MTRENTAECNKVMQAYVEGKTIQYTNAEMEDWIDIESPDWDWDSYDYRVKPEPKYRPFANAEECLKEMSKHTPFGWLKEIKRDIWTQISYIHNEGIETVNSGSVSYKSLFDCFTFFDRKPFGIKVEE